MSATTLELGVTRLAILALTGATAVFVAACGTSTTTSTQDNTGKPSASAPPTTNPSSAEPKPPPAPPVGQDEVEGLIGSVSGNTIRLTQRNRTEATVDFAPSTMITELVPAQLADVTSGSCVDVETGPDNAPPGGAITAQSVTINPSVDGNCPPLAPASGAPAESPGVDGKVTSVTADTIDVSGMDPTGKATSSTVTVTAATAYAKHAVTDPRALRDGKCMAARGTNSDGVLHATTIDLEPCPPLGRPHRHRFYLPHIPEIPPIPIPPIPAIPHVPPIPHIPHLP